MAPALSLPPINIHTLLRSYQLEPKKSLGQNFLVDPTALEHIVQAAEITPDAEVLEVGAGLGSLTRYLAHAAGRVVAVELDSRFIPVLEHVLAGEENITIIQGDILKLDPARLLEQEGYLVVANIPYYITSALIRHLLEAQRKPSRLVLTIQKEVAQRITASPDDMNLLALSVQVYGKPRQVLRIPAGAFYPPPKVDSEVIRIDLYPQPVIPPQELDVFFTLIKAGFSQKRKTLRNSVSAGLRWKAEPTETLLRSSGIDPQRRAETVSLNEWKILTHEYFRGLKDNRPYSEPQNDPDSF